MFKIRNTHLLVSVQEVNNTDSRFFAKGFENLAAKRNIEMFESHLTWVEAAILLIAGYCF